MEKTELNNKMFELLNKYHKTGNETNEIKSLIEQGADVNARDKESGETPLMYACGSYDYDKLGNGNLELARFLISKGADVNARDIDVGGTALGIAALSGNVEITKLLIDNGADVNAKDSQGITPLINAQLAIREKQQEAIEIAKILIEKGADVNMRDNNEMIQLLKNISTDELFESIELYLLNSEEAENYIKEYIKESLANGADINCVKDCQIEHIDEENGNIGYETLYGAYSAYNPNLKSVTPLMVAVTHNEYDLSKFLIENGADVNIKNKEGKTALDLVVEAHKTTLINGKSYPLKDNENLKNLIISKGGKRGIEIKPKVKAKAKTKQKSNDFGMGM